MMSALAGLRTLEAQISQAMLDVGATQSQAGYPGTAQQDPRSLLVDADLTMSRDTGTVGGLDFKA